MTLSFWSNKALAEKKQCAQEKIKYIFESNMTNIEKQRKKTLRSKPMLFNIQLVYR